MRAKSPRRSSVTINAVVSGKCDVDHKNTFFKWNCERPHTSCPTGQFTRPWQPYARSRRRAAAQADVGRHAAIYRATTDRERRDSDPQERAPNRALDLAPMIV